MTARKRIQWITLTPETLESARIDYADDRLWVDGRESYRQTLGGILDTHGRNGFVTERTKETVEKILGFNTNLRRTKNISLVPKPAPLMDYSPEPGTPAHTPTDVQIPAQDPPPEALLFIFDPPLNATQIGLGWGFKTGAVVNRIRAEHPDFPAPLNAEEAESVQVWSFGEVAEWTYIHQTVIQAALKRAQKQHAKADRAQTLEEENARLREQLAALTGGKAVEAK